MRKKQYKKEEKILKKIGLILRRILATLLIITVLWTISHHILVRVEAGKLVQRGEYVTVKGRNMNVYATGNGEKTIVLMPGLGTTSPVLDFEPLTNELEKDFRVIIIEPFGYGWSDNTDDERSVENIVEELRTALSESGEKGPYILMPHSVSGIYATWYANKYADEVEAIVGIDCSLPKQTVYFEGENPHVVNLAKVVNPLGIQRLLCLISPNSFISDNKSDEYAGDNLSQQKLLSNKVGFNATVINETNAVENNIEKTIDMKFMNTMPLLFFTRDIKNEEQGKNKENFYNIYISNPAIQKVVVFDSGHYMHWTKAHEIAKETKQFLEVYYGRNA